MMRYYEVLINELFPAGIPASWQEYAEGLDAIKPENDEPVCILPEPLQQLQLSYLASHREASEELAEQGQRIVTQMVSSVKEKKKGGLQDGFAGLMGLFTMNSSPQSMEAWKVQAKMERATLLRSMFWHECEAYLMNNSLVERPPRFGLGLRKDSDGKVWIVLRKKQEETTEEA